MPSYSRTVQIPGKSSQELYDKVSADIERFMSKTGIGKVEIQRDAGAKSVVVKAPMVTATLSCGEGSITVDAKLGLLATPFKSKIDDGITAWIGKTFNLKA